MLPMNLKRRDLRANVKKGGSFPYNKLKGGFWRNV